MGKTKFVPVNGQADSQALGKLNIVRPSKLAEEGFTGLVVEGIYEGSIPNKFNAEQNDYKVRGENGDLTILNDAGSLRSQMSKVAVGTLVQINYNGKVKITSGKNAGKSAHSFDVLTAMEA